MATSFVILEIDCSFNPIESTFVVFGNDWTTTTSQTFSIFDEVLPSACCLGTEVFEWDSGAALDASSYELTSPGVLAYTPPASIPSSGFA